jgi:hypothetical protein
VDAPIWDLQDSQHLLELILGLAVAGLWEFAYFVPLGFVAVMVSARNSRRARWLPVNPFALALAGVLAVLIRTLEMGGSHHSAAVSSLTLPLFACLFGTWIGTAWFRSRWARLLLLPKIVLLVLLVVLCAGGILWQSLETKPMDFEAAPVTSAEKRRLVRLVRSKSPRSLGDRQTHTLRLTEHDINVLLSWGLSLGSPDRKGKVTLANNRASLSTCVGFKPGDRGTRYLNIELDGNLEMRAESPKLDIYRCRLGSMKVPTWVLKCVGPVATSLLRNNRLSRPFMEATQAVSVESGAIQVTYGRVDMPEGFREDVFGPASTNEEVLASTRVQVDNLLAVVAGSPGGAPTFATCLETVFALARERSIGRDPIMENRAGILALGVLLGHPRIEEFLGSVFPERDTRVARSKLRRVTLRRRSDWTKHFCVSAAITLLSDDIVSDAAGLLKEELDADIGGSGFSFADLLADRAGTTFAVCATRDETAARAMQTLIADGFKVEEFFPPAADLPEGIPDSELQSRYGGVGGQRYRHMAEEIERRIAECLAYR